MSTKKIATNKVLWIFAIGQLGWSLLSGIIANWLVFFYQPSQEELDKLVGKTVQDLFDEGWTCWGWNLGDHILWMYGGPFSYTVEFTGELNDTEYFDESEAGSMTVKSVTYDGLGDATELD